jgi:uncharacterized membrane protein YgdD (TMEM256/DUF423 family)
LTANIEAKARKFMTKYAETSEVGMAKIWVAAGALAGLLAVAAGALGTHTLRGTLDADALRIFETAVRFQMYHALALLATGLFAEKWVGTWATLSGWMFLAGIVLFSGSLYILAMTGIGAFGAIAPLGGLSLMFGWAFLAIGAFRR